MFWAYSLKKSNTCCPQKMLAKIYLTKYRNICRPVVPETTKGEKKKSGKFRPKQ